MPVSPNYPCLFLPVKMMLQLVILPSLLVTAKLPGALLHDSSNKSMTPTRASSIHVTETFGDPFGMAPIMVKMMDHLAQTNFPLKAEYPTPKRVEHHKRMRKPPKNASLPIIPKDPVYSMDMFPGIVDDFMVRTIFDTLDESLSRENERVNFLPIDILDTNPDNPVSFSPIVHRLPDKTRSGVIVSPYRDERPGAIHKFEERPHSNDRPYVNHHSTIPPSTLPPIKNVTIGNVTISKLSLKNETINSTIIKGTLNNKALSNSTVNNKALSNSTVNNKTIGAINSSTKTTGKNSTHHKKDSHNHRTKRCKMHSLSNTDLLGERRINGGIESMDQGDDSNESMVSISFARSPDFDLNAPFHSPFRPMVDPNLFPGFDSLFSPDSSAQNEIVDVSNGTIVSNDGSSFNSSDIVDSGEPTIKIRAFHIGGLPNFLEQPRVMLYRWGYGLNRRAESVSKVINSSEDYDPDSDVSSTSSSTPCEIGSTDYFVNIMSVKIMSIQKCIAAFFILFCLSVLLLKKREDQKKGSILRV